MATALSFSPGSQFPPFHLDWLSFSFPVVVSTRQLDDPEELLILFSACSKTLPSSKSKPKSEITKLHNCNKEIRIKQVLLSLTIIFFQHKKRRASQYFPQFGNLPIFIHFVPCYNGHQQGNIKANNACFFMHSQQTCLFKLLHMQHNKAELYTLKKFPSTVLY